MRWGGMSRASHQNAWVAAFLAIVLKLMALPMASAFGTLSLEQLLTGSFCSSGGVQQVSLTLEKRAIALRQGGSSPLLLLPVRRCSTDSGASARGARIYRRVRVAADRTLALAIAPKPLAIDQP